MKYYILIATIYIFMPVAIKAQLKIATNLSAAALNGPVIKTVELTSVKNSQSSYATYVTSNESSNYSANYVGSTAAVLVNTINPISSRFGYYSPFYAEIITVNLYSNYYRNVPLIKYLPSYGQYYVENPSTANTLFNQIFPAYKYFSDNKPGYVPYQNERPASVNIDVGVTKPIPLQVDPANQAYWLYNTRFVRTFSLTY